MFSERDILFQVPEGDFVEHMGQQLSRKTWVCHNADDDLGQSLVFLGKIMAAVQLDLSQAVCICPVDSAMGVPIIKGITAYKPKQVIVFGVNPGLLGLNVAVQSYQALNFYGTDWIFADALSKIEADKDLKGKLWTAMKQIFV
jgi:hypothetical protein